MVERVKKALCVAKSKECRNASSASKPCVVGLNHRLGASLHFLTKVRLTPKRHEQVVETRITAHRRMGLIRVFAMQA